jgi:hypothetical protein
MPGYSPHRECPISPNRIVHRPRHLEQSIPMTTRRWARQPAADRQGATATLADVACGRPPRATNVLGANFAPSAMFPIGGIDDVVPAEIRAVPSWRPAAVPGGWPTCCTGTHRPPRGAIWSRAYGARRYACQDRACYSGRRARGTIRVLTEGTAGWVCPPTSTQR